MDLSLRATERRALTDPADWRSLVAALRRAGRVADARAVALAAFDRARDRCDLALPDSDMHAPRPLPREERRARLDVAEQACLDMDDALALERVLRAELQREEARDLCLCEASPLPHGQHVRRRRPA